MTANQSTDLSTLGIEVLPAEVSLGESYWRVTRLQSLSQADDPGEPRLYVDLLNEFGQPALGERIRVEFEDGVQEYEVQVALAGEPGIIVPLSGRRMQRVALAGGVPTDAVVIAREGSSPAGIHSLYLIWQQTLKKVFDHYVLFGPPDSPQTHANLIIALGYILRFKPAFGFKVEEAVLAERVTIIGGPEVISPEVQERLEDAGCWIQRIAGDSRAIDRVLSQLQERGIPYLS